MVTVHAETGERVLFVSPSFLKSIVGLTPRESQKILEILWEHVDAPRIHRALQVEPGRHRVLGQSLDGRTSRQPTSSNPISTASSIG